MNGGERTPTQAWERLSGLYGQALDLPQAERAAFVVAATADAPALRTELLEMLDVPTTAAAFEIERYLRVQQADDIVGLEGQDVGGYRVIRQIGRGGMGEVYLAERTGGTYTQAVALKILRAGLVGSQAVARFARERRILARLAHPAVAPLIDGGVAPDGRPYLVLQYVDGLPITRAADARGLDVRARLRQFIQVCRVVQYAHARLIIHRDLKPSNILATPDGDVRLLDFGIAKFLEPDPDAADEGDTRESLAPMTPERAAPEQLRGAPPSPATDVWALGVLLHELLTGRLPHHDVVADAASLADLSTRDLPRPSRVVVRPSGDITAQALAAARATTPAALARTLRGDLDTVIAKALDPDPERRYESAGRLADDVAAVLDGRPVSAQPDSAWYRTRKFVARNRLATVAVLLATIGVVAGAGIAVWQAREARAAEREAEAVAGFIASILGNASIDAPDSQSDLRVVDLLTRAHAQVASLIAPPEVRVRLLNLLGDALRGFGDSPAHDAVSQQAESEAGRLDGRHPEVARAHLGRAWAHMQRGRPDDAGRSLDVAIPLMEARPRVFALDMARALRLRADVALIKGEHDAAAAAARAAVAFGEQHLGTNHPEPAAAMRTLGEVLQEGDDAAQAVDVSRQALERTLAAHAGQPNHPWILSARELYARALADAGELVTAVAELERALALKTAIFGADARGVGISTHNLAGNQMRIGRYADAIAHNTRALAVLDRHVAPDALDYVNARNVRALLMLIARRGDEAVAAAERGLPATRNFFTGPAHVQVMSQRTAAALGRAYMGQMADATREADAVVAEMRGAGKVAPPVLVNIARINRLAGRHRLAREQLDEAEALLGTSAAGERGAVQVRIERASMAYDAGATDMRPVLEAALARLDALYPVETPWHADARMVLARLDLREGRGAAALEHAAKAAALWESLNPGSRWHADARRLQADARAGGGGRAPR